MGDPAPAYLPPLCNPLPYPLHYGSDDRVRIANASPHHLIRHILARDTCAHSGRRPYLSPLVTTPTIDDMASRSSSFSSVSSSRSRASSDTQETMQIFVKNVAGDTFPITIPPAEPLSAYNVTRESTLHMALPIRGGAPKKIRCNFKDCRDAAQRIVGDCGFCQGHFCGKHRMLESHACPGLEDCKQEEKDRNREKLESEKTVAIKGI